MELKDLYGHLPILFEDVHELKFSEGKDVKDVHAEVISEGQVVYSIHSDLNAIGVDNGTFSEYLYSLTRNGEKLLPVSCIQNGITNAVKQNYGSYYHAIVAKLRTISDSIPKEGLLKSDYEDVMSDTMWGAGGLNAAYIDPMSREKRFFYDRDGRIIKTIEGNIMTVFEYNMDMETPVSKTDIQYDYNEKLKKGAPTRWFETIYDTSGNGNIVLTTEKSMECITITHHQAYEKDGCKYRYLDSSVNPTTGLAKPKSDRIGEIKKERRVYVDRYEEDTGKWILDHAAVIKVYDSKFHDERYLVVFDSLLTTDVGYDGRVSKGYMQNRCVLGIDNLAFENVRELMDMPASTLIFGDLKWPDYAVEIDIENNRSVFTRPELCRKYWGKDIDIATHEFYTLPMPENEIDISYKVNENMTLSTHIFNDIKKPLQRINIDINGFSNMDFDYEDIVSQFRKAVVEYANTYIDTLTPDNEVLIDNINGFFDINATNFEESISAVVITVTNSYSDSESVKLTMVGSSIKDVTTIKYTSGNEVIDLYTDDEDTSLKFQNRTDDFSLSFVAEVELDKDDIFKLIPNEEDRKNAKEKFELWQEQLKKTATQQSSVGSTFLSMKPIHGQK